MLEITMKNLIEEDRDEQDYETDVALEDEIQSDDGWNKWAQDIKEEIGPQLKKERLQMLIIVQFFRNTFCRTSILCLP